MVHLTLFFLVTTLVTGVAGVTLFVQLHQRYAWRFLRSGIVQLVLYNAIVAVNVFYLYFSINLAGGVSSRVDLWAEVAYHAVSPVLKIAWVAWLYAMVRDLLDRPVGPRLRLAGWTAGSVVVPAVGALAGRAIATGSPEIVRILHAYTELPVIVAALAVIGFLVVRAGGIEDPDRRTLARELGLAVLAIWALATGTFLAGILFDLPGPEVRVLASSVLIFAYNLVPFLVVRRRLPGLATAPASADDDRGPDWGRLREKYGISPREKEIVELVCEGKRNREIAEALFISLQTVKDHNYRIYKKLGVKNRVQLVNLVRGDNP